MKITAKFSLAMAFIALIAIIIFNVVAYKEIFDITDSSAENSISATSAAQAEMVGSFVNELQNKKKNILTQKQSMLVVQENSLLATLLTIKPL